MKMTYFIWPPSPPLFDLAERPRL